MKKQRNYILTVGIVIIASALVMTACKDIQYQDPVPSTAAANTSARVLFVNASDASSLTTYIENVQSGSALTPGGTSGYLPIATNSSQIRVKGAGGVLGTADLSAKQTFLASTSYTVFITDTINRPLIKNALGTVTDPGGIRFVTVTDTLTAPTVGTAKVRFFDLSPDVATASARLTNVNSATSVTNLTNRSYRNGVAATVAAALRYTTLPAGPYITQAYSGTSIAATATPIASTTLTLTDGKIYTIYTRGVNRLKTVSIGSVQLN